MAFWNKKQEAPAEDRYEGEMENGMKHGRGTMYYKSGNVYKGQWRNGAKHGLGEFIFNTTGDHYVGEFINDKIGGYGRMTFHTGEIYEGHYTNGMRDGRGTLICPDGRRFEGDWVGDKLNGMAILWYSDGSVLRGNYANGKCLDGFTTKKSENGYWYQVRYVRPELENIEGCEVVLVSYPQDKLIPVIKEVREITEYGLALAKEITENAPQWLKKGLTLEEAVEIRKSLEAVGAVAEIR